MGQESDDRLEVVAPLPASHATASPAKAGQPLQPEAEAQPLAVQSALPQTVSTQHMPGGECNQGAAPSDAAAVPKVVIQSYVAWDALVTDDDSGVEAWPDHADPVAMDHDNVPAATKPSTFLEAACRVAGPEEVLHAARQASTSGGRQGESAGRASGTQHAASTSGCSANGHQRTSAAARRQHTVADHGWQRVCRKSNAAGTDVQNLSQPAAFERHAERVSPNMAADTNGGGAHNKFTRTQRRRQARKKIRAQQQQDY